MAARISGFDKNILSFTKIFRELYRISLERSLAQIRHMFGQLARNRTCPFGIAGFGHSPVLRFVCWVRFGLLRQPLTIQPRKRLRNFFIVPAWQASGPLEAPCEAPPEGPIVEGALRKWRIPKGR